MGDAWGVAGQILLLVPALALAGARWVKVAQREHYEPGRATVFARMWASSSRANLALLALGVLAGAAGWLPVHGWTALAVLAAVVGAAWPVGFPISWSDPGIRLTARAKRLIAVLVILLVAVAGIVREPARLMVLPLVLPLVVDLALFIATPLERRIGRHFVTAAQRKLDRLRPTVVAITGSYGKTSTKGYLAHLAGPDSGVVASPASFNNLMGLARSVNERLNSGDVVFVAEMGTYGPGEIRRLCELFPPDVAAITTIGEAHLERMGSTATVLRAKAEITETAGAVVLNVDSPELAQLAADLNGTKRVLRVSGGGTHEDVDVAVRPDDSHDSREWRVWLPGRQEPTSITAPVAGHPGNLAVALGLGLTIGLPADQMLRRMAGLPTPDHRAELHTLPNGVTVIDDTYNSNAIGAAAALEAAVQAAGPDGTVWVITPGMVELGEVQHDRNLEFGRQVGMQPRARLVVTHLTNRHALCAGAVAAGADLPVTHASRQAAAAQVMAVAREGDVVLFENDLPDHYP
jgi:UDP-N-acetylmuramoyl-tripeptide--D-alanyl-D-alanine ligase